MENTEELKVGDKVRLLTKDGENLSWSEYPEYGVIQQFRTNKGGDNVFAAVLFKDAAKLDLYDVLPIESRCSKLIKCGVKTKKNSK